MLAGLSCRGRPDLFPVDQFGTYGSQEDAFVLHALTPNYERRCVFVRLGSSYPTVPPEIRQF